MYLCLVQDAEVEELEIERISVVREFPDVIPDNLTEMLPGRKEKFTIDLVPRTLPISKAPYQMAPKEMEELKAQFAEFLKKRFIRLGISPWGAPVLFVKKEDVAEIVC